MQPSMRTVRMIAENRVTGRARTWSYPNFDGKYYEIPTYALTVVGTNDRGGAINREFNIIRFGVSSGTSLRGPRVVGLAESQTHLIKAWLPNYSVQSASSIERGAWQVYGNFLIHDGPDYPLKETYASVGCLELCGAPSMFYQFNTLIVSLSGATGGSRTEKLLAIGKSGKLQITYLKASRPALKPFAAGS